MPLGIQLRSEQKLEDMVEILSVLHKYVPRVTTTEKVHIPECEETLTLTKNKFFNTMIGEFSPTMKAYA